MLIIYDSFFDRISQSFKRDKWQPIVREIRKMWYTCAQQTGTVEIAARLLVEMMGSGMSAGYGIVSCC